VPRRRPAPIERIADLIAATDAPDDRRAGDHGYLDLLGTTAPPSPGLVQDLMLSGVVARIYERWWRPALGRVAKGALGPDMAGERRIAREMLALREGERVLDVACGTGAFTRDLGRAVGGNGLSVGIDVSETMLARAVETTAREPLPQVGFVRGDAQELPFRDGAFDAICCFAALNLFANAERALDRMTSTLAPGGRIAVFTSVRGRSTPLRSAERLIEWRTGIRMFERWEVVEALQQRGFGPVRQRLTGMTQFVGGRLPGG
jgi:SAM-dependent methyltransferase